MKIKIYIIIALALLTSCATNKHRSTYVKNAWKPAKVNWGCGANRGGKPATYLFNF